MSKEVKMRENPLGYEKISTLLRKFAVPSIISMLVSSLYNIVDQIFIGQGVGTIGNGATNVAFPFTTICLALSLTIGVGGAARFSLELGRGNKKEASYSIGVATTVGAMAGMLLLLCFEVFARPMLAAFGATETIMPYALDYVRVTALGMPVLVVTNTVSNLIHADGSPKYSMMCMAVGAVLNTILDPVFIFVFDMGIAGAAWATVISQIVSFFVTIVYLRRFKSVQVTKDCFRPGVNRSLRVMALGLSNGLNQAAVCLVQIVLNNSLTHYGAMTVYGADIPLSAVGVVMKVNSIIMSVFIGIQQGTRPIMGFNYGAKQYDRVKATYKLGILVDVIFAACGLFVFEVFPHVILNVFGKGNALYVEFGVLFMRVFLSTMIINGIQFLSANMFSSIGKPVKGVTLSLSRQFLLIPLVLILPRLFNMGIYGIIIAGPIADIVAVITSLFFVKSEFKNMDKLAKEGK
ncbi:MAG: MATE family efflux transporter [Ruminococcaceae bacterium]|nr:MATE family efflux transporter [Oscillospiraceae bacterium]